MDLFCGAGMASDGYHAAGFTEIVGWDINPQPNYPYDFHQGDALAVLADTDYLSGFDLIHASPPCQAHTRAKHLRAAQGGKSKYEDLLTPALALLRAQEVPWGVYHVPSDDIPQGGRTARNVEHGRQVMGVSRDLTWNELKEGFPPAYTQHVGGQAMHYLTMLTSQREVRV